MWRPWTPGFDFRAQGDAVIRSLDDISVADELVGGITCVREFISSVASRLRGVLVNSDDVSRPHRSVPLERLY